MQKSKQLGQVYTPAWIIKEILDRLNYQHDQILKKYILEPACGDGAFLTEIVARYIQSAQQAGFSQTEIINDLETYIYGVEIDETAYLACLENLNQLAQKTLNIETPIKWQIFRQDTLQIYSKYLTFFDYIVGNPPYIRVHNLDVPTREFIKRHFHFTKGTTDIYLAFFEMAFLMIKPEGQLGFITPNSFLYNSSYKAFRQYLQKEKIISEIIDFQSHKVFESFSTYTAITLFNFSKENQEIIYHEFDGSLIQFINKITLSDLDDNKWVLSSPKEKQLLNSVLSKDENLEKYFNIQYGFATLRDRIFIGELIELDENYGLFNQHKIEKSILSRIVKGSKYRGKKEEIEWVIFPYKQQNGRYVPYTEEELKAKFPCAYQYLLAHKSELLLRDLDKNSDWFVFGRSQGIQNANNEKIVLSTLINDKVNFFSLPPDVFVYSGIFITKKDHNTDWRMLSEALSSEEFFQYIRLTGKDFSGGYKSMSSKQIKQFKVGTKAKFIKCDTYQPSLFEE